jgi:hypothetical protein
MIKILTTFAALAATISPVTASTFCYEAKNGVRVEITTSNTIVSPPTKVIARNGKVKNCTLIEGGDEAPEKLDCPGERRAELQAIPKSDGFYFDKGFRYLGVAYHETKCPFASK